MKRLSVAAVVALGLSLPLCAQRGASHSGGFSGHTAPAFRGGFAASTPRGFTGTPRYTGSGFYSSAPRFSGGGSHSLARPNNYRHGAGYYRRPYPLRYPYGVPYIGAGWISANDWGYPDSTPYDNSDAASNYASEYAAPPADQESPPSVAPPYSNYVEPPHDTESPHVAPPPANEDAVTLIFKDGRPLEQIHNYAMTRTTLYVLDARHRDIPLDQLDLVATKKANHEAGIDFSLPETR
jgi:hypothetical protein